MSAGNTHLEYSWGDLEVYEISEYQRHAGAYPLSDSYEIFKVFGSSMFRK